VNQNTNTQRRLRSRPSVGPKLAGFLAALAACALLSACGSSSSGSNGSAGASNQGTKQENSRLKFTKCMREHGVNIPSTNSGSGPPAGISSIPQSTIKTAGNACRKYSAGSFGGAPSLNSTQATDTIVKFASCLRQTGINISDPTGSGTSGLQAFFQQLQQARQSPSFAAASKKCQSLLPKRGQGGGPGGAPGGGAGGEG
jgi:hypothetical protein